MQAPKHGRRVGAVLAKEEVMGYRARWVAIRNGRLDAALQVLGLRLHAKSDEQVYDTGHYAVDMPTGWLVVIGDGWDAMDSVQPSHAQALSAGTETLHFYCDDAAMCASLTAYRDLKQTWALAYDGSEGASSPTVSGAPPAAVTEALDRLQKQREASPDDGVDYLYEAAPQVGLALTAFRHDETLTSGAVRPIYVLGQP